MGGGGKGIAGASGCKIAGGLGYNLELVQAGNSTSVQTRTLRTCTEARRPTVDVNATR